MYGSRYGLTDGAASDRGPCPSNFIFVNNLHHISGLSLLLKNLLDTLRRDHKSFVKSQNICLYSHKGPKTSTS